MLNITHAIAYTAIALWLLTAAGNWLCQKLFALTRLKAAMTGSQNVAAPQRAGWIIGWLERLSLAIGIVTHSWEILAAVIALKTVARFKELDEQLFAEYFLVGSLFSILWAILVTALWLLYDHQFGMDLHQIVTSLAHPEPSAAAKG